MQVVYVFCHEKAGYMVKTMHVILMNKVTTDNDWRNEIVQEMIFPIRDRRSGKHRDVQYDGVWPQEVLDRGTGMIGLLRSTCSNTLVEK